jgi:hypothetical protein
MIPYTKIGDTIYLGGCEPKISVEAKQDITVSRTITYMPRTPEPTPKEIAEWRYWYKKICSMDLDVLRAKVRFYR